MAFTKERFKAKTDTVAAEIKDLLKEHGNDKIGEVTLSQIYQGMRGITGLVSETSLLDAQEGIRFRGYSIPELQQRLPKAQGGTEPLPEGLFHLMLMGELPTEEDVHEITANWQRRSHVPNHVFAAIEALPKDSHPMTQFVIAIMALQTESKFAEKYAKGLNKKDYWDAIFDDSMDLIARLPRVAAYIYRRKYKVTCRRGFESRGLLHLGADISAGETSLDQHARRRICRISQDHASFGADDGVAAIQGREGAHGIQRAHQGLQPLPCAS